MIGKTISHYEIRAKLGAGGMGVVYKAHDTTLGRDVALKFLPADLTGDDAARARFIHEARAAAALEHPNICTVYEVGEADGAMFIAMPLVEGDSLRDKIASGPVPVDEAIDLSLGVARGLSKAHASEIVHRDIKPGNVLLTAEGQAKIVDFGLAKLATQTRLTKTGMTVGTVSYMSPEQARGDEVDHRTDVWALGAMLYEMLAGRLPFRGDADQAVVYSILNTDPEPVTGVRREVPVALEDVVERALAKDPAKRYQTIDAMIEALETVREESRLGIDRRHRATLKRLTRRKRLVAGSALVLVVAIAAVLLTSIYRQGQVLDTLAVLPLENISGDERQNPLVDGITGELISSFMRVGGFKKVISRSASMRYKDTGKSPREIAEELDVKVLVGGMVQVQGDNLRISVELIDAETEEQIWSKSFESPREDFLVLQGEIAMTVVDEIHVEISQEERDRLRVDRPVNQAAWEAYLWGLDLAQRWTGERFVAAIDSFEHAIELDSTFAAPYAELAVLRAQGIAPPPYYDLPKAEALAARALELDPNSSRAHMALAAIKLDRDWDWDGAAREIREAERLGLAVPAGNLPWHFYQLSGYAEKAIEYAKMDVARDPLEPERYFDLSWVYSNANRPDDRIETCRKILDKFPDDDERVQEAWTDIANAYAQKGMADSAFAIIERKGIDTSDGGWDKLYMMAGQPERALERVKRVEKYIAESGVDPDVPESDKFKQESAGFAQAYSMAGDKEKALEWLERGVRLRCPWMVYLNTEIGDGGFDCLLGDPRFEDIIERVGIPRSYVPLRLPSVQQIRAE